MSDVNAVFYIYENVGLPVSETVDAIFYMYENVGVSGFSFAYVGSIHPLLNDMYGVFYIYENVT